MSLSPDDRVLGEECGLADDDDKEQFGGSDARYFGRLFCDFLGCDFFGTTKI